MRRTRPGFLVVAAVVGALIGFVLDQLLTAMQVPTFTPPYTMAVLFVVLGVAVLALAWPVRRSTRNPDAPRVDPFRAMRTAVLARASSLLAALVGGFSLGLLGFLVTRPVSPPVGSVTAVLVTLGASLVLLVSALVAEHFCTLPKDDDDDPTPDAGHAAHG